MIALLEGLFSEDARGPGGSKKIAAGLQPESPWLFLPSDEVVCAWLSIRLSNGNVKYGEGRFNGRYINEKGRVAKGKRGRIDTRQRALAIYRAGAVFRARIRSAGAFRKYFSI